MFWAAILKNHCDSRNQHPRIWLQSFVQKIKIPKLGTKVSDFRLLGLEFKNDAVIFEISTLEFA